MHPFPPMLCCADKTIAGADIPFLSKGQRQPLLTYFICKSCSVISIPFIFLNGYNMLKTQKINYL